MCNLVICILWLLLYMLHVLYKEGNNQRDTFQQVYVLNVLFNIEIEGRERRGKDEKKGEKEERR